MMNIDILKNQLASLCFDFADVCQKKHLKLVTAESCTAGLISGYLTNLPGSSEYIEGGFVTYSNHMKETILGINHHILERFGAVSEQIALEMVTGALQKASMANIAVAVTGIAGPNGGNLENPVGLVWIAVQQKNHKPLAKKYLFSGDREAIRVQTVIESIKLILMLS